MPEHLAPTLAQLTEALVAAASAVPADDNAMDAYLRTQIVETHAMLREAFRRDLGAAMREGVTAHLNNAATLATTPSPSPDTPFAARTAASMPP